MRSYNQVSQICGAGSEQNSKPILFLVKRKPHLGILKSNGIERIWLVHTNTLTPMNLVSCNNLLVEEHSDSPCRNAPEVHSSFQESALLPLDHSHCFRGLVFQQAPFPPWKLTHLKSHREPEEWAEDFLKGFYICELMSDFF